MKLLYNINNPVLLQRVVQLLYLSLFLSLIFTCISSINAYNICLGNIYWDELEHSFNHSYNVARHPFSFFIVVLIKSMLSLVVELLVIVGINASKNWVRVAYIILYFLWIVFVFFHISSIEGLDLKHLLLPTLVLFQVLFNSLAAYLLLLKEMRRIFTWYNCIE